MAGLLAWAADVVGGHGGNSNQDDDFNNIPLIFSPEQQQYVQELDRKASSLTRLIQDLRLRLPPPDISQRLPHLHAHSLASNAALALQLNAHSSTREQAQLREEMLQQENTAYENAISDCDGKIHEKVQEADMLRSKLKEMDEIEKNLRAELEDAETSFHASHSRKSADSVVESTMSAEDESKTEASKKPAILDKLEKKKNELISMEETVKDLENKWESIQNKASKQLSPAEGLIGEIHSKEKELERLSGLWTKLESSNAEATAARNRFGRGYSDRGSSSDFSVDYNPKLPYYTGGRSENQQRLMLLRSAFVLYIFALHILVFIRISF
ncbi:hypothetical protein CXB51_027885 [Gossypium anomalum]|uniref:Uncharacterized protein n=1 Tax=Gossypium anomalum TaxID=47600 RepID=A0A8J6CS96_9ROSI|nr:hypothetical protein CXB51_027885 [Gossypium anomalum]